MKIVFAPYRRKIWRKTIFHHVRFSDEIFLTFDEKVSAVSWKLLSTCPKETFAGFFPYILTFKTILDFGEKISAGFRFQSCIFNVHRNILKEMFSYAKKDVFFLDHLRKLVRRNLKISHKFLCRFVESAFYASSGTPMGEQSFEKNLCIFSFSQFEPVFFWGRVVETVF